MTNQLIVKANSLINASYNLEVTEQRLILLSIFHARETGKGITAESKLEIHARDYMEHFKVDKSAAYEALKGAVQNLFNRQFSFKEQEDDGTEFVVKSRWVSQIAYAEEQAKLQIIFAPAVVPLITKLEKQFTSYQLKQVSQLTSKYAIRLYEILISWRSVEKTPIFEIEDLRFRLGIEENEYKRMSDFKSRVLDPAIKQINEFTDIKAQYHQHKSGRIITGFDFKFKLKDQFQKGTPRPKNENIDLSDAQILLFANKLAYDNQFAAQYSEQGESYEAFEGRLRKDLKSKANQKLWIEDLKRVGFNN